MNLSELTITPPLQPGDNVIIAFHGPLDEEFVEVAHRELRQRFPGVLFTLLADVAHITVDMGGRAISTAVAEATANPGRVVEAKDQR